jgi:hypothetical protein
VPDRPARPRRSARPGRHRHADLLAVYLNDHVTGATAGVELFERSASARRGTSVGEQLARLAEEVAQDRRTYLALMEGLGVEVQRSKLALAWVGEKLTRLKGNGRLVRRSPLSDLVELEALYLAVRGKEAGWHSLRIVAEQDDRLDPAQLDELIAGAGRQIAVLERLRRDEVRRLFGGASG